MLYENTLLSLVFRLCMRLRNSGNCNGKTSLNCGYVFVKSRTSYLIHDTLVTVVGLVINVGVAVVDAVRLNVDMCAGNHQKHILPKRYEL